MVRWASVLRALRTQSTALSVGDAVCLGVSVADRLLAHPAARTGTADPSLLLLTRAGELRGLGAEVVRKGLGPFAWYSPELTAGRAVTAASDVWVTATVTWAALVGRSPFAGEGFVVLEAIMAGAVEAPLHHLRRDVPEALSALLQGALAVPATVGSLESLRAGLLPFVSEGPLDVARARLGALAFRLAPPRPPAGPLRDASEATTLAAIASGDETARLVYADQLEERGRPDHARWLRLESAVQQRPAGGEREALLAELSRLRDAVGREFLGTVARPALEGCPVRFGFRCPKRWQGLTPTAKPHVRYCASCDSSVEYFVSLDEAQVAAVRGQCVAIDLTVERHEGDLEEVHSGMMMGRLA